MDAGWRRPRRLVTYTCPTLERDDVPTAWDRTTSLMTWRETIPSLSLAPHAWMESVQGE